MVNLEAVIRGRKKGPRTAVSTSDEGDSRSVRRNEREESMSDRMMEAMEQAGAEWYWQHPNVKSN